MLETNNTVLPGMSAIVLPGLTAAATRFLDLVEPLTADQLRAPSQLPDWTPVTLGTGRNCTAISGMLQDLAAWLAGRPPVGGLSATAAADGVALPPLLPWPSGKPA